MSAVLVLKPVDIRKGPFEIQLASTSAIPQNNNPADEVEDHHHPKRSNRRSRYRQGSKGEQSTLALSSPICPRTHDENPTEKILRLEGNLHFLTQNYQQMLSGLHKEIQSLISKNQELQFQLVTGQIMKLDVKDDQEVVNARNTKLKNQISGLRRDMEQLRQALRDANDRNAYYKNLVEELKQHSKQRGLFGPEPKDELTGSSVTSRSTNRFPQMPLPTATRFKECEDTIQTLRKENAILKEELTRQERQRNSGPHRHRCSTRLPRIDTFPGRQYNSK